MEKTNKKASFDPGKSQKKPKYLASMKRLENMSFLIYRQLRLFRKLDCARQCAGKFVWISSNKLSAVELWLKDPKANPLGHVDGIYRNPARVNGRKIYQPTI